MIDVDLYRARIGSFSAPSAVRSLLKDERVPRSVRSPRIRMHFLFLFSLGFLLLLANVERNPGPKNFTPFLYKSDGEKSLFLQVKKLELFLVKVASHRTFLDFCRQNERIPSGLLSNLPLCALKPDGVLKEKFGTLNHDISFSSMDLILAHYRDRVIPDLQRDIRTARLELRKICDNDRYTFLNSCLDSFRHKELLQQKKRKEKKLTGIFYDFPNLNFPNFKLLKTPDATAPKNGVVIVGSRADLEAGGLVSGNERNTVTRQNWLPDLGGLTDLEHNYLVSGEELCDKLVTAGLRLITQKFPDISFTQQVYPLICYPIYQGLLYKFTIQDADTLSQQQT